MKSPLTWLVIRLGQDMNWWVDETSANVYWGADSLSVLDPNQVAYIAKALEELEEYDFDMSRFENAFHFFEVSSELPDDKLRLKPTEHELGDEGSQLFALPDLLDEDKGKYSELLDHLISAKIRQINATHHFVRDLTEEDMEEELQSRNTDRYFASTCIHVFNELEDILTWKPAEWDEAESGRDEQPAEDDND